MKPVSMAEVQEIVKHQEEKKPIHEYLKTFTKLSAAKAAELESELRALNNVKLKEEYIIKIVDLLPKDAEDLHKIFHDVSLEEQEITTVLDIVKGY